MSDAGARPTCFIAMPITTQTRDAELYNDDHEHWLHVMGTLFERAVDKAGFQPVRPKVSGAHMIHGEIIRHLSTADLVLVDLSAYNPNVFFELGVRTAINKPIALVHDEKHAKLPFDVSGINAYGYDSRLLAWEMDAQVNDLAQHISESNASCAGQNPLWKQFGLTITASEPNAGETPLEAKVDLLISRFSSIQEDVRGNRARSLEVSAHELAPFDEQGKLFVDEFHRYLKEGHSGRVPDHHIVLDGPGMLTIVYGDEFITGDLRRARELALQFGISVNLRSRRTDM